MAKTRKQRRLRLERIRKAANKLHHVWARYELATNYRGINYAGPFTNVNIDTETGIRYGVIPQNYVVQSWADSSEADYGDPHCPKCGNEAQDPSDIEIETDDWEGNGCGDYACEDCEYLFDGDEAFGDEPNGYYIDDGEYKATCGSSGDIFILESPYKTRAQFCSPCAPGACYLPDPCPVGDWCYCFGADWFDNEYSPCPYPIWSVATGKLVSPKS